MLFFGYAIIFVNTNKMKKDKTETRREIFRPQHFPDFQRNPPNENEAINNQEAPI
jgi:spermidine/putrescine-binding protein